ncbi:MAG: ATP-binding protein [Defluviicoccus sp.]|nr:ATP-binding protein [Defluviicoccus sp.]MDG4610385.1 ATP-binding protein [Defluviicoccus sp.]
MTGTAPILAFNDNEALGRVISVDTATVIVEISDAERLRRMQVNRLVALESDPGQHLIGIIQKITRRAQEPAVDTAVDADTDDLEQPLEQNLVRVALIGTLFGKRGSRSNVFQRTIESVPRISAACYPIEESRLTRFMQVIADVSATDGAARLSLGSYTLDSSAEAFLNGNKFFQRHAVIVGSTGSGKSWTTAHVLEQVAVLPNANALVFDIHGEYSPITGEGVRHFRVAGPGDLEGSAGLESGVLFLPHWLLSYDAMIPMFVDRSDENAPNQAMLMAQCVRDDKLKILRERNQDDIIRYFTVDSPVPFSMGNVIEALKIKNSEMVQGAKTGTEKQGPFHGKLSRLIARLESKITDRRLGFLFNGSSETENTEYLQHLSKVLFAGRQDQNSKTSGIKIIDFSEVPSDILPLIVSMIARMAFSIQQWTLPAQRHPIALFCDEAHNYIPDRAQADSASDVSIRIFERIAKEGRKYGLGLVVISQRPSEVNRTVLSQCNNVVAMRLTNADDQSRIRSLLPDNLGSYSELLPVLDTGEALVVGDASLLPTRIRVTPPKQEPSSATVPFWDRWSTSETIGGLEAAVASWQRQNIQK